MAAHTSLEYFNHPYFADRRQVSLVRTKRCRRVFEFLAPFTDLTKLAGNRVLDVGCDTGSFGRTAAELYGIAPVGIEVSPHAVVEARKNGLEVYRSALEEAPDIGTFPLITAIDVLEHSIDPEAFMSSLSARLGPGGFLYVQTPNHGSVIYQVGKVLCNVTRGRPGSLCERLFPQQHAQYLSRAGLRALADRCGLKVLGIRGECLSFAELAVPRLLGTGLMAMQMVDHVRDSGILTRVLLQK